MSGQLDFSPLSDNFERFNLNSDRRGLQSVGIFMIEVVCGHQTSAEGADGWCSNKLAPCMAKTSPSDKQTAEQCFGAIIRRQKLHIFSH